MKLLSRISVAILALVLVQQVDAIRSNQQITIAAGTPVRIASQPGTFVTHLFVQSKHSNSGLVYLLLGVPATTTCDATNAAHLTAELGPGDSTHPGATPWIDPPATSGSRPQDSEDMSLGCLDGTHSGDVVIVSFWRIN